MLTLFKTLINIRVQINDAQVLEDAFGQEPVDEFIDGMELVAQVLALKQRPGPLPPTSRPWKDIYSAMRNEMENGIDQNEAWRTAIAVYPQEVQFALTGAVNIVQTAILDFESQKKKRIKTRYYLRELHQLGYDFRLNLCNDRVEVNGKPIDDGLAAHIRSQMRDRGYHLSQEVEDAYTAAAWRRRYHPIRDYLSSLSWDGKPYIAELAQHFVDQHNVFALWLRKWLIGAVARAFSGTQNPMLVLVGGQNLGKSWFTRWLAKPFPREYYDDSPINPDEKDHQIKLISKFVWEVGELGSTTRRADVEALKRFLSSEIVSVRVPYARYPITKPALANFIGTVNNSGIGFLSDPTGNRRFLTTMILSIDWNYDQLDPGQIWAEAYAAYRSGEAWTLTKDEIARREEINQEFQVESPLEGLLAKYFYLDADNTNWWMATSDIIQILEDPYRGNYHGGGTRGTAMQLAEVMTRLGHRKEQRVVGNYRSRGYVGISLKP